jgi:uncharacterized protein YukE
MSRTQIKVHELEEFARQIGKAEQECDQTLDAINWHFNSLLANFPGAVPGHIHNLEADFKYSIKRYKSKLDDAQRLVKLTAAKMEEADRKMSGKVGNFLLELVGWYDLQRLAGEYDPVTGEKLSAGDKTLAAIMLGLSIFPPAKAVGIGGKVAVAGTKAGKAGAKVDFPMFAKDPKIFTSIRNVLDTGKVLQAFRKVYNDVVVGPLAATKVWFDSVIKKLGDLPIPMNLQVQLAGVGAYQKTVREAFQEAKEQISRIVVGKGDEVGKGTGKNVSEININKAQLATKPAYSPLPEKWVKKGGFVKIEKDGTWVYTNKKGQTVRYPNGFPDFTPYSHPTVKPVEIEFANPTNRPLDYKNANIKSELNKDSDPPITSLYEAPEGYTWHHHQDGKTMILVDKKVHREFTHTGGVSAIKLNN